MSDVARAMPARGTVRQMASCEHCWRLLEKTDTSQGWYHSDTGEREC